MTFKLKKKRKTMSHAELLQDARGKILHENSPYAYKEAYVRLRTNLMFTLSTNESSKCKVVAITSSNPSEGKTTTSINMAISFAMLGKKTLLIDADMRKPRVGKIIGVDSSHGLSNLLGNIGECDVYTLSDVALDFITSGKTPPNPAELLSAGGFATAIERFKQEYDYIFIDTPPVNVVADAQIIASHVDGVVLVVRANATTSQGLRRAETAIKSSGGRIVGVVANDVTAKSREYNYSKYRYYKYYKKSYYEDYK